MLLTDYFLNRAVKRLSFIAMGQFVLSIIVREERAQWVKFVLRVRSFFNIYEIYTGMHSTHQLIELIKLHDLGKFFLWIFWENF